MNYYVIGAGSIGRRHAQNLAMLGASVTLHPWRGIDIDRLLSDVASCKGRSGIVIATGTQVRVPLIIECAAAGAALYIEKPLAFEPSDLEKIFELPCEILQRSLVGFMMRYNPIVQKLISFHDIRMFRAHFEIGHNVKKWRKDWKFSESYASIPGGGGVLLDLCHEIDLAHLLCGPAPLISVTCINHPDFHGVDIATNLHFASSDGRSFNVTMDYLAETLIRRGSLVGLGSQIDYDLVRNSITKIENRRASTQNFSYHRNNMFLELMSDFMALAEGRPVKNQLIPRLDRVREICTTISNAWMMRSFTGQLKIDLT